MTGSDAKSADPPAVFRKYGRALVVVAHPDDPEFLFGATIASLVHDGVPVQYVVCTNGANGSRDWQMPAEELTAVRYREQRAAAELLGVESVRFLGFPDGCLEATPTLRLAIAREIRRVKPDLVLTHYPGRVLHLPIEASHPDHVAVGEATLAAISPDAANGRACAELLREGLHPHRVREVWIPGYTSTNHYVDAAPFIETKFTAIRCHRSQLGDGLTGEVPAWVPDWMRRSGKKGGYAYAEEFWRITLR
jgi:LmbE family N-acetylglucosaminyl deacetylase